MQEQNGRQWLYNMNDDPTEQVNLVQSQPDRLQLMGEILAQLDAQMAEPLWPTTSESEIVIDYPINQLPDGDYETILWNN